MRCEYDNTHMVEVKVGRRLMLECPSCNLYNAAVHAQKAAAEHIAKTADSTATGAWLNEYGVFAWVDCKDSGHPDVKRVCTQLGTPEEAAPFAALTGAARQVTKFWKDSTVGKKSA
jgi:hypothetical protein